MDVIKCRHCNSENGSDRTFCWNCYSSLTSTGGSEKEVKAPPAVAAEALSEPGPAAAPDSADEDASEAAFLLSGPASIPAQPDPPPADSYASAQDDEVEEDLSFEPNPPPARTSPGYYTATATASAFGSQSGTGPATQPAPHVASGDQEVNWRMVVGVIIMMGCATIAAWWFFVRIPTPSETVQRFLDACQAGDLTTVKLYATQSSAELLASPETEQYFLRRYQTGEAGFRMKIVGTSFEGEINEKAVVKCEPDIPNFPSGIITIDFVLFREDGRWRVDIAESASRTSKALSDRVKARSAPARQGG